MTNQDSDLALLEKAAEQLSEHFDAVHIFACRHDMNHEGGTVFVHKGVGNYFTRYGMVREWIDKMERGEEEDAD